MISQTELKTFIPAIVAPCILLVEAYTGKHISDSVQSALTNGIIIGLSFAGTIWGIYKDHKKKVTEEGQPQKIPPDNGVHIIEETQQKSVPIATQADYNKQISN